MSRAIACTRRDAKRVTSRGKALTMALSRLARAQLPTRRFASHSTGSSPPSFNTVGPYQVFDRNVKCMQKNRAALRKDSRMLDYVRDEVADRMMERFLVHPSLYGLGMLSERIRLCRISNATSIPSSISVQVQVILPSCLRLTK